MVSDHQPQYVVGDPLPIADDLQAVVRLQHCSYTLVNDPRENLFGSAVAGLTHRSRTARSRREIFRFSADIRKLAPASDYPMTLRTTPCGLEVDNHVNCRFLLGI